MKLDDFIAKYTGKVVRGGQCGELVRQYWIDVDQTNPPSYPDSKDYWFNDVPGYEKVSTPQPGDIAIYNGHGKYPEGHSAIYVDGRVFEQNADPDGSPAHLATRNSPYLLGYLRKQGASMADKSLPTSTQVGELFQAIAGRQPRQDELDLFVGLNWFDGLKFLFPIVQETRDKVALLENDRDTNLYPTIEKQKAEIADLTKKLAEAGNNPTDPNSIVVTQSGLWAAFKRFLN